MKEYHINFSTKHAWVKGFFFFNYTKMGKPISAGCPIYLRSKTVTITQIQEPPKKRPNWDRACGLGIEQRTAASEPAMM
jgi:hypothetical protein